MALLEPMAHITLIWLIMSFLFHRGRPPIGDHWIFFYATGVLPYLMLMHLGNRGAQGHRPYGRLLEVPIIKPVSVLMGAAISELMLSATATMLIFGMFYYFGLFSSVNNFYAVVAAFLTVWLLGVGLMFLNAGIGVVLSRLVDHLAHPASRDLFCVRHLPPGATDATGHSRHHHLESLAHCH